MTHWKLTLAYDGTPYSGWQIQPNLPTVQGLLADAIHRTTGERVLPQGSGRTDAGVHALAQVASFALAAPIPAANLQRALNRCLPPSIRVLAAEAVPPDFHARHSALHKTYEYRIFPLKPVTALDWVPHSSQSHCNLWGESASAAAGGPHPGPETWEEKICPPTLAPYVWPCPWPLSLDALNRAARHVLGTQDFTTFAAAEPDLAHRTTPAPRTQPSTLLTTPTLQPETQPPLPPGTPSLQAWPSQTAANEGALAPGVRSLPPVEHSSVRTITHSQWHAADGLLVYRVTADGFLHHMVRNLVGTFVQAGAQRLSPDSIPALLAARNRAAAGPTAPPTGLFLVSVEYPETCQAPEPSNFSVTE